MSVATPRPPRSDDRQDAEALEALIEEARQRARRRRRGYAAFALVAVAAGLIGFYGFNHGGGAARPTDGVEQPPGNVGAGSQVADAGLRTPAGLEGGAIEAIALDPQHPNTLFAATLEAGVFKSSNGGRSWRALDIAPNSNRVDALAIAPQDPQTIYAGTGGGIFKTTDGGATWQAVNSGLFGDETAAERQHRLLEGFAFAFAIGGTQGETVYAATWGGGLREGLAGEGLRKSTNGGASWQTTAFEGSVVTALALDPADPGTVYVGGLSLERGGGYQTGVYKSTDGGASWYATGLQGVSDGTDPASIVNSLALVPTAPETIYAGTGHGVFVSSDGGTTWQKAGLEDKDISWLVLNPKNSENVYAQSKDQVFVTTDGGRTWRALTEGWVSGTWPTALALNPRNPSMLYLGTIPAVDGKGDVGAGLFKSVDGGHSWQPVNAGLTTARVSSLALDTKTPGIAYAAIDGGGVFKRAEGRWQPANRGLTSEGVHAIAVDPRDPANVYAGTDNGVFKSADGGQSWRRVTMTRRTFDAVAADPRHPQVVYAVTGDGGWDDDPGRLYKSTDGGVTWSKGTQVHAPIALDPLHANTLYAGGLGVRKSVDGGTTWRNASLTRMEVHALAVDPMKPATVYAGTDVGLFKSTDAGASWQALHGPLDGILVEALTIDPRHGRTVYAGTDRGVFWTADGGQSWRRFDHLPLRTFDALAVDSAAGRLYAGAYGGGIYELKLR
jgi:photosystem II stability/assembly factor-like uncharacterized protein